MHVVNLVIPVAFGIVIDDAEHDSIEMAIAATLPEIPGLVSGLSQDERVAILCLEAARSRAVFIAIHGDPFGCAVDFSGKVAAQNESVALDEAQIALVQ